MHSASKKNKNKNVTACELKYIFSALKKDTKQVWIHAKGIKKTGNAGIRSASHRSDRQKR